MVDIRTVLWVWNSDDDDKRAAPVQRVVSVSSRLWRYKNYRSESVVNQ